jgi:ATPase subunit of ABC transporter with duplicated ATPase domains
LDAITLHLVSHPCLKGTGKSTLMQAILSRLESDADTSLSVAYVGQNDAERSTNVGSTVLEYCLKGNAHIQRLKDEMASLEDDDHSDQLHAAERIGAIMEQLEVYERTEPAKRALATLRSLGFTKKSSEGPVDGLSGGWRTRLEIARSLFAQPNVLMLDEPTNHLDLHAVLHLASMLRHSAMKNTTLIVVSHDASFLDLVCTDIIAVHNQHLQCFSGNYAEFEKKAEEYRASHERRYKNRLQEEARQKESIVQAKAKARKSTNDKALKQVSVIGRLISHSAHFLSYSKALGPIS